MSETPSPPEDPVSMALIEAALDHWPDASLLLGRTLLQLLAAAKVQCAAYAPVGTDLETGTGWLAVVYQARDLAKAGTGNGDVLVSDENGQIYARDLTATVKSLLRPPVRVPVVG